jgi:hypothetical protein
VSDFAFSFFPLTKNREQQTAAFRFLTGIDKKPIRNIFFVAAV